MTETVTSGIETQDDFSNTDPLPLRSVSPDVPYRVLLLGNLLGKMMDRVTAQHVRAAADLTLAQWRVMSQIEMLGKCSAGEIASAALADRAEVSRALATLEKRQLIKREPDPQHRQKSFISFTEMGKTLFDAIRTKRMKFFQEWLIDLDQQELASLDAGLSTIMRRILDSAPDAFED